MAIIDKIERNINGVILFKDANDNVITSTAGGGLTVYANGTDFVRIQNQGSEYLQIEVALLTRLQVDPDPETVFAGTAQDLIAELAASFFFDVTSGGGSTSSSIAANATSVFINRTGIVNATIESAIYDLVFDLTEADLWSKMVGFYPQVGGNAFAHGTNLKDPLKYNLTFFGGWTHSANGALPNGINGYANTNIPYNAPELFFGGTYLNRTLAYYSRTVSASSGVLLGLNDGGQTVDYLFPNPITSAISGEAVFAGSTATTKLMAVSMADGVDGIFYRDTVSLPMAFYVTSPSISDPYFLAASNQLGGTPGFFSNCQCALAFISTGLTLAELNIVNTIVNSFQLALTRNV